MQYGWWLMVYAASKDGALGAQFFAQYTRLLQSTNYVTRRQSLKVWPSRHRASNCAHTLLHRLCMSMQWN